MLNSTQDKNDHNNDGSCKKTLKEIGKKLLFLCVLCGGTAGFATACVFARCADGYAPVTGQTCSEAAGRCAGYSAIAVAGFFGLAKVAGMVTDCCGKSDDVAVAHTEQNAPQV